MSKKKSAKRKVKAVSMRLSCGCGHSFIAAFASGKFARIVQCPHCKTPIFTSGHKSKNVACLGCSRPFLNPLDKACTYCGRPKDEKKAARWISDKPESALTKSYGKDRVK